jgi:hypothetical protein
MVTTNASAVIGHARMRHQQTRHFVSLRRFFRRLVQLADLLSRLLSRTNKSCRRCAAQPCSGNSRSAFAPPHSTACASSAPRGSTSNAAIRS